VLVSGHCCLEKTSAQNWKNRSLMQIFSLSLSCSHTHKMSIDTAVCVNMETDPYRKFRRLQEGSKTVILNKHSLHEQYLYEIC